MIKVVDECTKNHQKLDDEITTAHMPARPGNPKYLVSSFQKYIEHLSLKSDALWKTPKYDDYSTATENNSIWYYGKVGHNKLDSFVSDISYACGIEHRTYTNHSLRHTVLTILKKLNFVTRLSCLSVAINQLQASIHKS